MKTIGLASHLHRLTRVAELASARERRVRLPCGEYAWAEWSWGEITCVTSVGPQVADGLITHSPELLVCLHKKPDYGFLAFQIFFCPSLGSGCTQSQLLNPSLWTIRHHLTPSMSNSPALLSQTCLSPTRSGDRWAEDFIPYASVV